MYFKGLFDLLSLGSFFTSRTFLGLNFTGPFWVCEKGRGLYGIQCGHCCEILRWIWSLLLTQSFVWMPTQPRFKNKRASGLSKIAWSTAWLRQILSDQLKYLWHLHYSISTWNSTKSFELHFTWPIANQYQNFCTVINHVIKGTLFRIKRKFILPWITFLCFVSWLFYNKNPLKMAGWRASANRCCSRTVNLMVSPGFNSSNQK